MDTFYETYMESLFDYLDGVIDIDFSQDEDDIVECLTEDISDELEIDIPLIVSKYLEYKQGSE